MFFPHCVEPGFCSDEAPIPKGGGRHPIIRINFPENCMKIKKIGPRVGVSLKFHNVDWPLTTSKIISTLKELQ